METSTEGEGVVTTDPDFLTVAEIVAMGWSKADVYRWLDQTDPAKPHLPSYRIGRARRIARADWHAFLRAHTYRGKG
jgi:hypothetical protein